MVSLLKGQEFCSSIGIFNFWNFQYRYLGFKFSFPQLSNYKKKKKLTYVRAY